MSPGTLRLFTALELPARVRAELEAWRQPLREGPGLRLVAPESLHVTLCFLGSVAVEQVEGLAGALASVADLPEPVLAPAGALWLPRRRPGVLAVRLEDRGGNLARLQAKLASALERGGWYRPERRPYLAHVTVARVRPEAELPRPPEGPAGGEFRTEEVTLLRSHLSREEARYEVLSRVRLGSEATAG